MIPPPEIDNVIEPAPDDRVMVGLYSTATDGFDHGLVVVAMGRSCWLIPSEAGYRLLVEPRGIEEVQRQLRCFDHESIGWPPPPFEPPGPARRIELLTPVIWALLALVCFWGEAEHPSWVERGALDTQAVFGHHEWWRTVTALFLHADADHLVSNALIGIIIFAAVTTTFGRVRGWALLAGAAILGNFSVAALNYPGPYRSIGASTAVFAGVGLLTGRALRLVVRAAIRPRWRAVFTPLAAGFTVLGLYGAGGVRVDIMAHVTGFAAGVVLGFIWVKAANPASVTT